VKLTKHKKELEDSIELKKKKELYNEKLNKKFNEMDKSVVLEKYYDFLDERNDYSNESEVLYLKYLISLNNYVYDPYILLMELYFKNNELEKGIEIINLGYSRLMKKEFNNNFPKQLDYLELENRSIYRLIYNYADMLWFAEENDKALNIFKKLLKINPNDNLGVRYAICGMLEGYSSSRHVWNENGQIISK
jgi:tetratricopeptide (TPR) repeat protein